MPEEERPPRQRGERRGGRWPHGKPGPKPGQKPFDPLSQTWTPMGQSWLARKAKTDKARRLAESQFLAAHFQLDPQGRLPEEEQAGNKGVRARAADHKRLTDFPVIPPGELQRLEGIIEKYGLPLTALSSRVAAFVMRRVMLDYFKMSNLRKTTKPPMFTPEELVELMRVLQVKPTQLADMVAPPKEGGRNNALGSIHRWMHGASTPTSLLAIKINRLIEQRVRRSMVGGYPGKIEGVPHSDKPVTVERRERKYKERRRKKEEMVIPVSQSAREALEREADASQRSDERPPDRGE